jgi:hypothetical protein
VAVGPVCLRRVNGPLQRFTCDAAARSGLPDPIEGGVATGDGRFGRRGGRSFVAPELCA